MSQDNHLDPCQYISRRLAAKLADACVDPSYMADLLAVYCRRFEEVLAAELAGSTGQS